MKKLKKLKKLRKLKKLNILDNIDNIENKLKISPSLNMYELLATEGPARQILTSRGIIDTDINSIIKFRLNCYSSFPPQGAHSLERTSTVVTLHESIAGPTLVVVKVSLVVWVSSVWA